MYRFTAILIFLLLASCQSESDKDPLLISKNSVGFLTDSTSLREAYKIYSEDSIVTNSGSKSFRTSSEDIDVYEKGGKKLLTMIPKKPGDSTSVMKSIQIFDPNLKTSKGISLASTFKDINDNYTISSISNLINSIVVSVNELNASFTIDKKELPSNLRYDMQMNIEKAQIPDEAKVKFLILHWD